MAVTGTRPEAAARRDQRSRRGRGDPAGRGGAPVGRHLASAPPRSLTASVLAAGLENIDLGLERLPPRRRRGSRRWLLLVGAGLGVAIYTVLGGRLSGGDAAAPTAPAAAPPSRPTMVELETLRAVAASAGALGTEPEMVPGPGGVLVRTRPVEPNYIVAPGDTLELIAQRFGTTVEALVGMNNIRDRHSLRVGQPLIIP
jgi:hypothetical protein